jgi:hypothetical protein
MASLSDTDVSSGYSKAVWQQHDKYFPLLPMTWIGYSSQIFHFVFLVGHQQQNVIVEMYQMFNENLHVGDVMNSFHCKQMPNGCLLLQFVYIAVCFEESRSKCVSHPLKNEKYNY